MSLEYQQVGVKCPVCASEKLIQLPHNLFEQKKFGNIKIQVPENLVCEHTFILFLDNKGVVRGYERIDVLFDFEKVEKDLKEQKSKEFSLRDILIRLGDFILYHLLHGYVFNYPTYLLCQKIDVAFIGAIEKLFTKVSPLKIGETSSITPIEFHAYDDIKLKDKDALILSPEGYVVQCPWISNTEFERQLVKQALDIIDLDSQNIVMEKEIESFIVQAEKIIELLEPVKSIYDTDLIKDLADELMQPKISNNRLIALKEYIGRKYDPKIPKKIKNKVGEFLKML